MAETAVETTTEDVIFDAALHVFARKGRDGARMQEIAEEAGVTVDKVELALTVADTVSLEQPVGEDGIRGLPPGFGGRSTSRGSGGKSP